MGSPPPPPKVVGGKRDGWRKRNKKLPPYRAFKKRKKSRRQFFSHNRARQQQKKRKRRILTFSRNRSADHYSPRSHCESGQIARPLPPLPFCADYCCSTTIPHFPEFRGKKKRGGVIIFSLSSAPKIREVGGGRSPPSGRVEDWAPCSEQTGRG